VTIIFFMAAQSDAVDRIGREILRFTLFSTSVCDKRKEVGPAKGTGESPWMKRASGA
jgi:hypothetical protein